MPRLSQTDINTEEYWDGIYRAGRFPVHTPLFQARYIAAAEMQAGQTALDIGCGLGALGEVLIRHHPTVTYIGVDYSGEGLARNIYLHGLYVRADWRDIHGTADTVYALDILEHLDDPRAFLAHAAGLARQRLVVGVPRYKCIPLSLHRGEHMWDFTEEEMREMMAPYGRIGDFIPCGSRGAQECCVVGVDRCNT